MLSDRGQVPKTTIALANDNDRSAIYRIRHQVYATEIAQHQERSSGELKDSLDEVNVYIVARIGGIVVGFISITPPDSERFSIDKYLSRNDVPCDFDKGLYEVRLLTVVKSHRSSIVSALLMYAALRWIEMQGGTRILAIGRKEIVGLYGKIGMKILGKTIQSGAVTYELMSETIEGIHKVLKRYTSILRNMERKVDWAMDMPFYSPAPCYHGGAFFEAIGEEFKDLSKNEMIINADVLDAWFPPSPRVQEILQAYLPWIMRTSPPTQCEGLVNVIARTRNIAPDCILPGAGSSDLIFLAFRHWLNSQSKALILNPMYGEYAHVLEHIIHCRVDRLSLPRDKGYALDANTLRKKVNEGYDIIVLVNPNNPTGHVLQQKELQEVLQLVPESTLIWIDETYLEYAGQGHSLERFATQSRNVVVGKSLSKVYALSGLRAAYACANKKIIEDLRAITPPWAVSLPAQIAAVYALQDREYYSQRYLETARLRQELVGQLQGLGIAEIVSGVGNYILFHLPESGPDTKTLVRQCRSRGLYIRDVSSMGENLSNHAVRIAVKDSCTNDKMIKVIGDVLHSFSL